MKIMIGHDSNNGSIKIAILDWPIEGLSEKALAANFVESGNYPLTWTHIDPATDATENGTTGGVLLYNAIVKGAGLIPH